MWQIGRGSRQGRGWREKRVNVGGINEVKEGNEAGKKEKEREMRQEKVIESD